MLQYLQSWDGESYVIFDQNDILNIRMTLLYSWLTGGDFNIDIKSILGVDPGIFLFLYVMIPFLFRSLKSDKWSELPFFCISQYVLIFLLFRPSSIT